MLTTLSLLAVLAAAQTASTGTVAASTAPAKPGLRLLTPAEYPDFNETFADKKSLLKAAAKSVHYLESLKNAKYFRIGETDYGVGQLADSVKELAEIVKTTRTPEAFNALIAERFDVYQSVGLDGAGRVVFSSYYQPMLPASRKKTEKYRFPLYKRPTDMVDVDLAAFDKANEGKPPLIGRVGPDKRVVPYWTRADIDLRKSLAGKGLELAWLSERFHVLDIHIQGSGILKFPDGKKMLAKYAATNAHPYNSVGLTLVKAGVFTKEEINRQKLKDYLRAHGDAEAWIISQNPRFTFFDMVPLPADGEPVGTTSESLVPSRSIAVDPAFIPLGALAFFTTVSPQADKDGRLLGQFPNSRFAFCHDTGGAIKSPGRVDIYVGHGKQADTIAPLQWNDGKLYILVKKVPARDR